MARVIIQLNYRGFDVSASWTQSNNQSTTTVAYTLRSVSDTSFWFSPSNLSLKLGYGFAPSERLSVGFSFQPIRSSMKAGYLFSLLTQVNDVVEGHGVNAGLILSFGKWELDAAYSYASSPITNVPGYIAPLSKLHFGLTRTGNFIGK